MWKRNKDKKTGNKEMEAGASKEESAAPATDGGEDLSMEEILQSIRKIIADDEGDDASETPTEKTPEKTNGKGTSMDDDEDVPGSDMLELTEMLSEDGTIVNVKEEADAKKPADKADDASADDAASFDILNQIDEALTEDEAPAEEAAAEPAPVAEPPTPKATVKEKEEKEEAAPAAEVNNDDVDSLLSDEAAKATSAAFDKLKTADSKPKPVPTGAMPPLRSGGTIEDMIQEMLQPMLKGWLDDNLSGIVEEIVEREVKKLTR